MYPVAIVNDKGVEPVEEFTLILSNPQPAAVVLDPGSFIISITDDDDDGKFVQNTTEAVDGLGL